jgi:hypothetical protein
MEEKFGIENLQKLLSFGVNLGTSISSEAKDGFNINDVFNLLPQLMQIPDFIKNKDTIINEAKDLSIEEIKQLVATVNGVIKDEHVVSIITNALNVAVSVVALVQDFKAIQDAKEPEPGTPETPAP